jgi:hypothetical protein
LEVLQFLDNQSRLRLAYDFLPVLDSSAPANKALNILIGWTTMPEDVARKLAFIQLAKWYCDDIFEYFRISFDIHVPQNAAAVRAVFDDFGVEYQTASEVDEQDVNAVADLARTLDCDLVVSTRAEDLRAVYTDELGLVSHDPTAILHAIEIHMKGFDAPWSFELPSKNMPWSNFYLMSEHSVFGSLLLEHRSSHAAGPDVYEIMRSLVADSLPALCFSRDRLEFYRQQDRWAQRQGLEHQDFGIEYAAYLNHFYLTFYAAVDQVVALVVTLYKMPVPARSIGATYAAFREARKAHPMIEDAFSDKAFWKMYDLPQRIRHMAAHKGPVKPQDVYFGEDNFTEEQLDKAAEEYGLLENYNFVVKRNFPKEAIDNALWIARTKARLKLMGPPRRHGVYIRKGKKGVFYYPGPASDLRRFLQFFDRVLEIVKPWDETNQPASVVVGDA